MIYQSDIFVVMLGHMVHHVIVVNHVLYSNDIVVGMVDHMVYQSDIVIVVLRLIHYGDIVVFAMS